ncbi:MAG: tyrosine-type recombinase/integrase [Oscillospiraceae bacterium]|nr:tyrosine-type recombinase/integrase [Oscillospiraceae bacterium]
MKYDILDNLRHHLYVKYNNNTAKKYYHAVKSLFHGYDFNNEYQIHAEEIERRMLRLRTKNDFSAAKRGLLELKACFPALRIPDNDFFEATAAHKRNYKKRTFEPLQFDTVKRKINAIRDKKLKLSYRLMLASGARVAEVAALRPCDITISNDNMQVQIIDGKGGKDRTVKTLEDDYLRRELPELLETTDEDKPVFYSTKHMKNKAAELGIECHDLRRVFAQTYKQECKKTEGAFAANSRVMEALGHTKFRTTRRYLNRKIVFGKGD